MTDVLSHPGVRAYLLEVHRLVAAVDPASADAIMGEVADHIRDAATDRGTDDDAVDVILRDLGDPALIAAGVDAPAPPVTPDPPVRFADTNVGVVVTLGLLTIGSLLVPLLGWFAGIYFLWSSSRWTRGDKIAGTLVWPAVLILVPFSTALGGSGLRAWHLGILLAFVAPFVVAVVLFLRAQSTGDASPARRALPVERAGAASALDRWTAGALVTGVPVLGAGLVLGPPLAVGTWSALVPTAICAGVLGLVAVAVLWLSRGWTTAGRTWGTITIALVAATVYGATRAAIQASSPLMSCGTEGCVTLPTRLGAPGTLLTAIAVAVVPAAIAHALVVASGFRSPRERTGIRARQAFLVPVLLVAGSFGMPALVAVRFAPSVSLLLAAVLGAAVWTIGAVLLIRSPLWRDRDTAIGWVPLAMVALFLLWGTPFTIAGTPDVNPLVPPTIDYSPAVTVIVCIIVQAAASAWLAIVRIRAKRTVQPDLARRP